MGSSSFTTKTCGDFVVLCCAVLYCVVLYWARVDGEARVGHCVRFMK